MELLQLRYFCTVARMENISHAARYHIVPQSAMSKTISKLERELGIQLFTRVKNRLALTEEGKILYEGVRNAMFNLDNALQEICDRKGSGELTGEVKCLVLEHRYNMVDCVVAFKKIYPKVQFSISYSDIMDNISEYDMCIVSKIPEGQDYISESLTRESLKIAVASTHPLAKQKSITLDKIKDESFVMISPESTLLKILRIHCERRGFLPKVAIYVDDLLCIEKYVSSGLGITVVPEVSWKQLSFQGATLLPVDEPNFARETLIVRTKLKPMNKAANTFYQFLQENFNNLIGIDFKSGT